MPITRLSRLFRAFGRRNRGRSNIIRFNEFASLRVGPDSFNASSIIREFRRLGGQIGNDSAREILRQLRREISGGSGIGGSGRNLLNSIRVSVARSGGVIGPGLSIRTNLIDVEAVVTGRATVRLSGRVVDVRNFSITQHGTFTTSSVSAGGFDVIRQGLGSRIGGRFEEEVSQRIGSSFTYGDERVSTQVEVDTIVLGAVGFR